MAQGIEDRGIFAQSRDRLLRQERDASQYSPLNLAFIGDSVFELVVRTILVEQANRPVRELQRRAGRILSAAMQAQMAEKIVPLLTEEEEAIYRRGRNAKPHTKAKNATLSDYLKATGLEALIGYLYLKGEDDRARALIRLGMEVAEASIE